MPSLLPGLTLTKYVGFVKILALKFVQIDHEEMPDAGRICGETEQET